MLSMRYIFPTTTVIHKEDLEECASFEDTECIVTTEKDAVKIAHMDVPVNLFYLSIEAVIEGENKLIELLLKKIGIQPRRSLDTGVRGQGLHIIQ